jgi:hypothetical protein
MFFSRRRGCPELAANAASVPTLTSGALAVGLLAVGLERRAALATVALAVRLAGVDLVVVVFLAAAVLVTFDGLLARTGRSLMACTSLSSDSPTLGREAAEWMRLTESAGLGTGANTT